LFIIRKLPRDKNEKDFMHFLDMLPEHGIVLDIGANLGVMSYYLARGYPKREVFAFEPIPYNYDNLKKIARRFRLKNLEIFNLALGDKNGIIEMVLPVEHAVRFHGLAHVKHETIEENNEGELFQCSVRRLDDLFKDQENKPFAITGIKIDVENFEYFVLKGAKKLLKKHMPLIYCELWENENRRKTIAMLANLGYKTKVMEHKKLVTFDPGKHLTQNFFFVQG
jgi:FkbM family methyltransferase